MITAYLNRYMDLKSNFPEFLKTIPPKVKLVVVTKTQPIEAIREIYDLGQRRFGENKAQELISKHPMLPQDIEWHFIGHLQTNKVKQVVQVASVIHSVDSDRLLQEIEKEAANFQRKLDVMLQIDIAMEETKFGLDFEEARDLLRSDLARSLRFTRIIGIMGMATFTDDTTLVKSEFRMLRYCFDELKREFFRDEESFREISMGMSGDYKIAMEEGSTIIRIGSAIFGERNKIQ